jgi:CDP-6-deoxy-D-xylo-4-hexulose-3-dehydrase
MVRKDAPFSRSGIIAHLEREGVETRPIVAGNLARQPVAERFPELRGRTFQGADEIHRRGFYIGLSPVQPNASMDRLLDVFDRFLRNY